MKSKLRNKLIVQRILVSLFTFVWWNRLHYKDINERIVFTPVIKVKSWNSAIVNHWYGERATITFDIIYEIGQFIKRILKGE